MFWKASKFKLCSYECHIIDFLVECGFIEPYLGILSHTEVVAVRPSLGRGSSFSSFSRLQCFALFPASQHLTNPALCLDQNRFCYLGDDYTCSLFLCPCDTNIENVLECGGWISFNFEWIFISFH